MSDSAQAPEVPYNANPDLVKMRHDIAERNYGIMTKGMLISGIGAVAGAIVGALLLPEILIGGAALGGMGMLVSAFMGGVVGLMAGGAISHVVTMRDEKKLQIDEEMVGSYMQGKNYWGEGYRKEVAEYGYGGPQQPTTAHRDRVQQQQAAVPVQER